MAAMCHHMKKDSNDCLIRSKGGEWMNEPINGAEMPNVEDATKLVESCKGLPLENLKVLGCLSLVVAGLLVIKNI